MRLTLIALLACALTARAADKDELKKLEGTWDVVEVAAGGKDLTKQDGVPRTLTVKDGTLKGFGPDIKLSTDATQKPKWLNMTFAREGKDVTVNAIYELTGDELKICLPMAPAKGSGKGFENKRPEGFETKDKPEMMLRVKKAK